MTTVKIFHIEFPNFRITIPAIWDASIQSCTFVSELLKHSISGDASKYEVCEYEYASKSGSKVCIE